MTQRGIHTLIALSALAAKVLGKLPVAVFYGIFLFTGISTIGGNDLVDRMFLWLIWTSRSSRPTRFRTLAFTSFCRQRRTT